MRYPHNLPKRYRWHWDHPWTNRARLHPGFRSWLNRHGYLTPNFKKSEARCKDGTWVPSSLLRNCRNHAFNLEQLRHALGEPITPISWYRTPAYNRYIGGASQSQHMKAIATDLSREWVNRVGRDRFNYHADKIFRNGGVGRYPAGSVHVDSRGWRARWSSF
jgi:hypothetical protein